jgi:hypothetical protein
MNLKLKSVPKSEYKPKKACVYLITHPNYYEDGTYLRRVVNGDWSTYVGVTANYVKLRWKDHKAHRTRDNQHTTHFIKDHGYEFEDCFRVIFEGTVDQCYKLEYHLRQTPNTGMNKKVGGKLKHRKFDARYFDMIFEATNSLRCKHLSTRRTTGSDPYSDYICNDCGSPC